MSEKIKERPATGARYASVSEMLKGRGADDGLISDVDDKLETCAVVRSLVKRRLEAGLKQSEVAEVLGVTQSAVSKIESGRDEDLTLGVLKAYAEASKGSLCMIVGKRHSHADWVKFHANGINHHLMQLAELAQDDPELQRGIREFFGEAFFNLLGILTNCAGRLPGLEGEEGAVEVYFAGEPAPAPQMATA